LYSIVLASLLAGSAAAQTAPTPPRSAPISNLRYDVTFDSMTAATRTIKVQLSFDVAGPGPVLLSLPAWTPGAYELSWFARWVLNFDAAGSAGAQAAARPLEWDKLDYDTWRIQPKGAKSISVRFDYLADTLDNAMAWARPDFALFNGTNLFLYPEGRGTDFPATVTVKTSPGWLVATGMAGAAGGAYREGNYHDLVDKPFFVGRFDYDSTQVAGVWTRLASYPAGMLKGPARSTLWDEIGKMIPAEAAVFGETPWRAYNVMMIFDSSSGGGSALEHTNSHVGVYSPGLIGTPILASITAHEIFHAWNVKRMRPSDMVPYRYDRMEPTPWLWVSEGITDYYADLALVRGGIVRPDAFMNVTGGKVNTVSESPPTALEDASLSTWIHPVDGSGYLYYPKGSLAGFMLDVMIRDASDNKKSLDTVMRELYRTTYKQGRGFTGADWWGAVSRAAGGKNFGEFAAKYVNGREPFPWDRVLPMAGMRTASDTIKQPRLGLSGGQDSSGAIVINGVLPGGVADKAGMKVGDILLALGDLSVTDSPDFGAAYRAKFAKHQDGDSLPIKVRRGNDTLTLHGTVSLMAQVEHRIVADSAASAKAARIREGIVTGKTD
jgi:predicted metalloprotease with PDZ domain